MNTAVADTKPQNPLVAFKGQLDQRADQFRSALPAHIPPERFQRVVLTAVQRNPDLLRADRRSLWNAAMQAAQDGLLPDGREGAIVTFNTKVKRKKEGSNAVYEETIVMAQWMPMIGGIRKKARNSGELSGINAHVVFHADTFRFWVDENGPHLIYEPADNPPVITAENAAKEVRLVFAWARTKDGELFIERMSVPDVEKVRSISRAKDGAAWSKWWDQMAIKTVVRRLSKVLPMSSDLDDLIRRDDELYDLTNKPATPTVIDMDAVDTTRSDAALPAPPEQNTPAAGSSGGADAPNADGGREERDAAPPPDTSSKKKAEREPTQLEQDVGNSLLDCRTDTECDGVRTLYGKEINDAPAEVRAAIELLIDSRKQHIEHKRQAAEEDDFFPGDGPAPE